MEQLELKTPQGWVQKKLQVSVTQIVIAVVVIGGAGFYAGSATASFRQPIYDARAPEQVDLAPFFSSWNLLNEHFAPATTTAVIEAEDKLWGAIQGLAAAYGDDYTVFLPPVQKQIFETEVAGGFEGVGMEIGKRNGILTVIAPIKDTPAFRAGIKSGDLILKIDGESTLNMAVDEAVGHIRGKGGTVVTLSLAREGKDDGAEFEIKVTRDTIVLPTLDATMRDDGIYYIQLYSFNGMSPQLFADAIQTFIASGKDKLIIDLRGNPGGFLESAADMVSWFLPAGELIVTSDYGGDRQDTTYKSAGFGSLQNKDIKIVILIDGGSASASEIMAGAMKDHGRATLIGTQSFGKGSVQQLFDVTETTQLKITVARWLTPNGTSISHQGLTPDIEVKITAEDREGDKDPQLDRAVEFLNTGK